MHYKCSAFWVMVDNSLTQSLIYGFITSFRILFQFQEQAQDVQMARWSESVFKVKRIFKRKLSNGFHKI